MILLMDNHYNKVLRELECQINNMEIELDNPIELAESGISITLTHLKELKDYILKSDFDSIEEEIYFFKKLKPNIVSKLIYYNAIYKIEMKKPYGNGNSVKKHFKTELSKLKRYFDNNLDFYKYYRTNSSYLDHKYFVRGNFDIKLSLDTYYFESDHTFSTSHDYKVAKIITNDLIQVYLEDQLFHLSKKSINKIKPLNSPQLQWTASKAALIELIYALQAQNTFDNGQSDIKCIAKHFENIFNIDLGDFYHTYLELRNRKMNRTKFLDLLKDSLINKMDEQDEKIR